MDPAAAMGMTNIMTEVEDGVPMPGKPNADAMGALGAPDTAFNNNMLDFEPNPFEKSFARNDGPQMPMQKAPQQIPELTVSLSSVLNADLPQDENIGALQTQAQISSQQQPQQQPQIQLQPPSMSQLNSSSMMRFTGMTPPVLTPGGTRRLPVSSLLPPIPGVLSPGGSIIGTPGIWNSIFPANGQGSVLLQKDPTDLNHPVPSNVSLLDHQQVQQQQQQAQQGQAQQGQAQQSQQQAPQPDQQSLAQPSLQVNGDPNQQQPQQAQQSAQQAQQTQQPTQQQIEQAQQQQQLYNMILNTKKTGLTPNESLIRTGLTPGGNLMTQFGGMTSLENGQMTPGLMSILAASNELTQQQQQGQGQAQQQTQPGQQPQVQQQSMPLTMPINLPEEKVPISKNIPNGVRPQRLTRKRSQLLQSVTPEPGERPAKKKATAKKTGVATAGTTAIAVNGKKKVETKKRKNGANEQEKRQSFLERNRLAASKCRERKKHMIEKMKTDLKDYKEENEDLRHQVDQLRDYAMTLRSVIFSHKHCEGLLDSVGGLSSLVTMFNGGENKSSEISMQALPSFLHELPRRVKEEEEDEEDGDKDKS